VRGTIDQIARGLRAMHRLELIHQDLKPDNILLDEFNTLKIIDFGSTKIAGLAEIKSVVDHNQIVGTANYSAPEYFKGETGTNRSDIYSLGVIAYEMLTGKLPYGEVTPERADKKKFHYTSARQYNPLVPDWMDACLQKAVSPNPEKRYGLLSEFVTDFSKPNQSLLDKTTSQPLLERNPLAFWRGIVILQSVIILVLIYFLSVGK
jgi:serine/threonine protein kinase